MNLEWDNTAESLLKSQQGQLLMNHKETIGRIAASGDGQKVKAMMEGNKDIEAAMTSGDVQALGRALSGILKTEEGARLAAQLGGLMQKP